MIMVQDIFSAVSSNPIFLVIAILLIGYIIGRIAKTFIIKLTETSGLRQKLRFGLEKEAKKLGFQVDLVYLFALIVKYLIYIITIFVALDFIHVQTASSFLILLLAYLPQIIAAILIVLLGGAITEIFCDIIKFKLRDYLDEYFGEPGFYSSPSTLIASCIRYFLYLIIFVSALLQLGLRVDALMWMLLVFAIVFVLTIAIIFILSLKDYMPNLSAGANLKHSKNINIGDFVTINTISGEVEQIGQFNVIIKNGNKKYYVPNSKFLEDGFMIIKK